MINLVTNTINN